MTKEEILQIPKLKAAGVSHAELVKRFGVSIATINYWVKRLRAEGHKVDRLRGGGRKKIELKDVK